LMIIVSGIRSIICIRLRPRSLMSSESEPTASSGDLDASALIP
jgi:hypothetical protein